MRERLAKGFRRIAPASLAVAASRSRPFPADADDVRSFRNDWTGNSIVVEAVPDPKVEGMTCHITRFDRSLIDRLSKGSWFIDPSNSSIACRRPGRSPSATSTTTARARKCFSQRLSLIFKALAVRRIYDKKNETLVYVIYSRQVKDASAKMAISTVPLFRSEVDLGQGQEVHRRNLGTLP